MAPRFSILHSAVSQVMTYFALNDGALYRPAISAASHGVFVDPQRTEAMVVVAAMKQRLGGLEASLPYLEQTLELDDEQQRAGHDHQTISAELRRRVEALIAAAGQAE